MQILSNYTCSHWSEIRIFRRSSKLLIGQNPFISLTYLQLKCMTLQKTYLHILNVHQNLKHLCTSLQCSLHQEVIAQRALDRYEIQSFLLNKLFKWRISGTLGYPLVCHLFVVNTFWHHLWSITERTHGNMESITWWYYIIIFDMLIDTDFSQEANRRTYTI